MSSVPVAQVVDELLEDWNEIRPRIEGADVDDHGAIQRALALSRKCDVLAREVSTVELARINQIRAWLLTQQLPTGLRASQSATLTRQEAVELLRDSSGADLSAALTERFGITDDDLLLSFKYVIREDVLDAARRASRHLVAKPRGAIGREVREDLRLVLDTLANEGEVVE